MTESDYNRSSWQFMDLASLFNSVPKPHLGWSSGFCFNKLLVIRLRRWLTLAELIQIGVYLNKLGGKKKEMIPRPLASFLLLPDQWFLRTEPEGVMSPADAFVQLWLVFSEDWTFQNSTCLCECGSCSSTCESPDFSNRTWAALTQSWDLVKSDRDFLSEVFFEKHLQLLLGVREAPPSV